MLLHQTNLFSINKNNVINCVTEFKIRCDAETVCIDAHGIEIKEIYAIYNQKRINLNYTITEPFDMLENFKTNFNDSLYQTVKGFKQNLVVNLFSKEADSIIIIRIVYSTLSHNPLVYKNKDIENHKEIYCLPFYPTFTNDKSSCETIIVYPDNLTSVAPGTIAKKDKRNGMVFQSYSTDNSDYLPFVVGTFKYIDILQGTNKCRIFLPFNYNIEPEFKYDISLLLNYISEIFHKKNFAFSIIFTYNNIQTVSCNAIFFPISIFPSKGIDQNIFIRERLCKFLSKMFFIKLKCNDFWLAVGLREYLRYTFLRVLFGETETHFRTKQDLDFVCDNDINEPSLIREFDKNHKDESYVYFNKDFSKTDTFKKIKSRLFFQILENNLSRAFMEKIILTIFEINETNTMEFIKTIKDVSGRDMTAFFDYYIFKPGVIKVKISYELDRKGKVDLIVKQTATSKKKNANRRLFGELKLKVTEQEGVYEHKFISNMLTFQCHYRTKKRKTEKEMREAKKLEIQKEKTDLLENIDEPMEQYENLNPLLYMRADTEIENMAKIEIEQSDYMFIEQLISEKNIFSQIDSINALKMKPSEESIQALEKILNDPHTFYKVRIMILFVLSRINIAINNEEGNFNYDIDAKNLGFQRIIHYFIKRGCVPGSTIPKPNDFSFFTSYFLLKNTSSALSIVDPEFEREFNNRIIKIKSITCAFFTNILKYNNVDDEMLVQNNLFLQNAISNSNYIASIIESLSYHLTSKSSVDLEPIINELERKRLYDIIFPSYQNLITTSILKCYGRLCFYGFIELHFNTILNLAQKQNFISVREAAIEILATCFLTESFEFLVSLILNDTRDIKIYILNIFKSLIELKDENFLKSDEYREIYNNINTTEMDFNINFNFKKRLELLLCNDLFFDFLKIFYYDKIIFELLTDIIYLNENKIRRYELEEEVIPIEEQNFIIKFSINNIIHLKLNDKLKKEISDIKQVYRTEPYFERENKTATISPYKIKIKRLDIVHLQIDDFVSKYFNSIEDFVKKNIKTIKNIDQKLGESDLNWHSSYYKNIDEDVTAVVEHKTDQELSTPLKLESEIMDEKNAFSLDLGNELKNFYQFDNYSENELHSRDDCKMEKKFVLEQLLKIMRYDNIDFDYDKFLIFIIYKFLKRHKYFSKISCPSSKKYTIKECKSELHKHFISYYSSQKYGSQYYLNAKALEMFFETLFIDFSLFESYIKMDDIIFKKCKELLDYVLNLNECFVFIDPVDYVSLNIPNYSDIIRVPINLDFINSKMCNDKYFCLEFFIRDLERVFLNCMEYNEKNCELYITAKNILISIRKKILQDILSFFSSEFENVNEKILYCTSYSILDYPEIYLKLEQFKDKDLVFTVVHQILLNTRKLKEAANFTFEINNPEYIKIVKKQMHLSKMIEKVENKEYISIGHVFHDMNMIVKNCTLINGSSSWVVRICKKMESFFKKEISYAFSLRNIVPIKKEN